MSEHGGILDFGSFAAVAGGAFGLLTAALWVAVWAGLEIFDAYGGPAAWGYAVAWCLLLLVVGYAIRVRYFGGELA